MLARAFTNSATNQKAADLTSTASDDDSLDLAFQGCIERISPL